MSLYLATGQGADTDPPGVGMHLPMARPRRYPSDTSDAEWALIGPYLPAGGRGGRPVLYPRRDIVDAIRYLDHNSCVWRALPVDFPPSPVADRTACLLPHRDPHLGRRRLRGQLVNWATATLHLTITIVRKLAGQTTFQPLPRRWVVERTFSWINRCRRTVRDYERHPDHHAAMIQWAMVIIMTRRLARHRK